MKKVFGLIALVGLLGLCVLCLAPVNYPPGGGGGVVNDTYVTNLYNTNFYSGKITVNNLYASNTFVTNLYVSANETYYTNSGTQAPDFNKGYQLFSTNAAFTFLAPIGVDTTKIQAQTAVVVVTNSTAAAVLVSPPAGVYQQGTWYVTNVTTFTFFTYASTFTNAYAIPLY